MDINNLLKFISLRDDSHAQYEIRVYAEVMAKAVEKHFPFVWEAYINTKESITLTQNQINYLINGGSVNISAFSKSEVTQADALVEKYYQG